jgi:hypothetical protein
MLRALRSLAGLHSRYEDLLAYRDRELSRLGHWCVGTHLRHCRVCQQEAEQIESKLRSFERMKRLTFARTFLNMPKGVGQLRKAIAAWEGVNPMGTEAREPIGTIGRAGLRQLETEFDLYLGVRTTAAFLMKMGSGKEKQGGVIAEAESVLRDFIGPSAASAVTQRVLRVHMLLDRSVQGSLPA